MIILGQNIVEGEIMVPERDVIETIPPALAKSDFITYLPLIVIFSAGLIGLYVYKK